MITSRPAPTTLSAISLNSNLSAFLPPDSEFGAEAADHRIVAAVAVKSVVASTAYDAVITDIPIEIVVAIGAERRSGPWPDLIVSFPSFPLNT